MKKLLLTILILGIITESSLGLVINEVLANEPGSITSLEWIELYNNQATSQSLSGFEISLSNGTIILPDSVTLAPGEYYIICRNLFLSVNTPGFETVWGDSSGIWGDTPFENSIQQPFEAVFAIRNGSGNETIVLIDNGTVVSGFVYNGPGLDGYSWERVMPNLNLVLQSLVIGGSPGAFNTVSPVPFDLSMDSVDVSINNSTTQIIFYVSNKGDNNVSGAVLSILENNSSIDLFEVGSVIAGQSVSLIREYNFSGLYIPLTATLSQDDRMANNSLDFTAVGSDFPPLILTELMANPFDDLNTEWFEIKNISTEIIDLSMWQFGDILNLHKISDTTILINPDEYFVIANSINNFLNFFLLYNGIIIEPTQWATFNNSGDILRLVDMYNIEADRFAYDSTFSGNFTWSKSEDSQNRWGRSTVEHGSPGELNSVFFAPTGEELTIDINPTHFSPDGDGFEDETIISINVPAADNYTVKIYDRFGRVVKTFHDQIINIDDQFQLIWNGYSDGNIRLPIGIYILLVEADGVTSQKETLVIAR